MEVKTLRIKFQEKSRSRKKLEQHFSVKQVFVANFGKCLTGRQFCDTFVSVITIVSRCPIIHDVFISGIRNLCKCGNSEKNKTENESHYLLYLSWKISPLNHLLLLSGSVHSTLVDQYTSGTHRILVRNKIIFNSFDNFIAAAIVEIGQEKTTCVLLVCLNLCLSSGRLRHRETRLLCCIR